MSARFMYFEAEEGGMNTFEFSTAEELSCLCGWGEESCKEDDESLLSWVENSEVGEVFEHRLGYAVKLKDA